MLTFWVQFVIVHVTRNILMLVRPTDKKRQLVITISLSVCLLNAKNLRNLNQRNIKTLNISFIRKRLKLHFLVENQVHYKLQFSLEVFLRDTTVVLIQSQKKRYTDLYPIKIDLDLAILKSVINLNTIHHLSIHLSAADNTEQIKTI